MRLVHIKSARPSTKGKAAGAARPSPAAYEDSRTSSRASTFAAAEDHRSAPAASLALHAVAQLLNPILKLVRIHAEVLRLAHRAANRDGFRRRIAASAVQR